MLEIWGRKNSFNVQKVLWCCEELEVPYQRHDAGGLFGGTGEDEYLQRNPTGLVPTIVDGDLALWESNTIVRYLSAKYGSGNLWPEDPAERALADKWMDYQLGTLFPAFKGALLGLVRTAPEKEGPSEDRRLRPRHRRRNRRSRRTPRRQRLRGWLLLYHGRRRPGIARLPLAGAGHREARPARPPGLVRATRRSSRLPENRHGFLRDGGPARIRGLT